MEVCPDVSADLKLAGYYRRGCPITHTHRKKLVQQWLEVLSEM